MPSLFRKYGIVLPLYKVIRLRNLRYYQGKYYDSMKYGVFRSEWEIYN